jgi:hypothetical protein
MHRIIHGDKEVAVKLPRSGPRSDTQSAPAIGDTPAGLKAGDLVRVRSREEIKATLDDRNELKGCLFMSEMWTYCGTAQRVLKPVRRFLDERTYEVMRCEGIVLLERLICQGSVYPKGCDHSCFFFWREEWLEKIE